MISVLRAEQTYIALMQRARPVTAGPFEKSLFHDVQDKFSVGVAFGGGLTIEQKLDDVLPVLIETDEPEHQRSPE
jgi:hypothetical protein